jgi:secondary thiamine-phosphate synthase enzyme
MSVYELSVPTRSRCEFIDITHKVEERVRESGVTDGVCMVYVPHTTAGVTINENADPSVRRDILDALARAVPDDAAYSHGEGNSPAHIKASLMGSSVAVAVAGGRLVLGTWQGIFLCEFDGPRRRTALVQIGGFAE